MNESVMRELLQSLEESRFYLYQWNNLNKPGETSIPVAVVRHLDENISLIRTSLMNIEGFTTTTFYDPDAEVPTPQSFYKD